MASDWQRCALLAMAVVLFALGDPASARTIAFDVAPARAEPGDAPLLIEGFLFRSEPLPGGVRPFIEVGEPRDWGGLYNANNSRLEMAASDGRAFDLTGFDVARRLSDPGYVRSAARIEVTGTLAGGGEVRFATGALEVLFRPVLLPVSFTGLLSVTFDPVRNLGGGIHDYEFLLDNVAVTRAVAPVPLPPGLPLLLTGLFGLAVSRTVRRC